MWAFLGLCSASASASPRVLAERDRPGRRLGHLLFFPPADWQPSSSSSPRLDYLATAHIRYPQHPLLFWQREHIPRLYFSISHQIRPSDQGMTRGPVSASPEPEADRGQAEQDDEAQQQQQQQEGGDQQVTISEEPASIEMSSSPSSSDQDHSHRASTPPAPIKLATVPEPARAAGQTEDGEGEGEERVQQQQEQQQRMSSPPSSSSPVQEGGDEAGQAGGGTASPFAASPSSEHSNLPSTSDARGGSVAEPEETNPRGGRQEERPERPARGQTRQTSREYKETLDAKTKDEKVGHQQ